MKLSSWLSAALLLLPACMADYLLVTPLVQSSGHLPQALHVRFLFTTRTTAATAQPAAGDGFVIDFAGLTNANTGLAVDYGWVPFIKNLNGGTIVAFPGITATTLAITNLITAYSYNPQTFATTTCNFASIGTSVDGKRLVVQYGAVPCTRGVLWEFDIPLQYISSNPPFAEVLVAYTFAQWDVSPAQSPFLPVEVPWKTSSTQLIASSLHLTSIRPSSTILGAQLTSLEVTFTPGKQLLGGHWLSLFVSANNAAPTLAAPVITQAGLFNAAPAAVGGGALPTISVGVANCAATPQDIYCCSVSTVSQPGGATDTNRVRIQLQPAGCILPAGKLAYFVIPQVYLGLNPTLPATAGATTAAPALATTPIDVVVNAWISSSSDPQAIHEARLGQAWAGINGIGPNAPAALATLGDIDSQSLGTSGFGNYFGSWLIGSSTVANFAATPIPLTSGVVPSQMTVSWTITSGIPLPTAAPAAIPLASVTIAARYVISPTQGVFKPNQGTVKNQLLFPPNPNNNCPRASYYTNEFGTLFITPNALPVTALCYTLGLTANTVLTYVLPSSILLPNPTPQTILFDIRGIPDQFLTGILWNGIDAATLKMAIGYTTTADCNTEAVPNFLFTSPSDIASLQFADRCRLVSAISWMSTGPAAIRSCLTGAAGGTVTWTKFPEGTWRASSWPQTNVAAAGDWAQVVGINPPIAIQDWGHMVSYPMFAIVVTYPPVVSSLTSLGVTDTVPVGWRLVFIVRNDRLTLSCAVAALSNPWLFYAVTTSTVVGVKHIGSSNVVRAAGSVTAVDALAGGGWAQRNGAVGVTVPQSGLVFGYAALTPSPIPDDGSDDALFGLLALIAIPVLLCCCLLALLWFCRPKAEACPCVPEYPVQEMYWVNAQPCAPTYSVAQCGPSTTPVYLVQ